MCTTDDSHKTREQLLTELTDLRQQLAQSGAAAQANHQQMQRSLAASEERGEQFRTMAESLLYGVWLWGPAGEMLYMSPDYQKLLGVTLEEMKGLNWTNWLSPDQREPTLEALRQCIASGGDWERDLHFRDRQGRHRIIMSRGKPLRDAAGAVTGWAGISLDMTDRRGIEAGQLAEIDALTRQVAGMAAQVISLRRHAKDLTEQRESADASLRAKDDFLAMLSHELRTPLTPVLLLVSALGDDAELPPRLRDDLAMIRRNVELETRLVDDLLDVSRIIRGKIVIHRALVSVHRVLLAAVDVVRSEMTSKRLNLRLELGAQHSELWGDAARLQQVFWNLLRNAVKFTPEGGHITVRTRNGEEEGTEARRHEGTEELPTTRLSSPKSADCPLPTLRIQVIDTGVGIDPAMLPRIFSAFEQAGRDGGFPGGLGLGLTITRGIVDLHGGSIRADSAGHGQGATFTVELPLAPAPAETASTASAPPPTPASPPPPRRLLLVEDHVDTALLLSRLLTNLGYQVQVAHDGATAMHLAEAAPEPFDLLISDMGLPDMSSTELMNELRRRGKVTAAIALSGYGTEEDVRRSLDAGFREHLLKPVRLEQLQDAIQRALVPPR